MLSANKKTVLLYSVSIVVTLLAMISTACSESLDVSSVGEAPAEHLPVAQNQDSLSADTQIPVAGDSVVSVDSGVQDSNVHALFENISITGNTASLGDIASANGLSNVHPIVRLYELDSVTLDTTGNIFKGSYDKVAGTFRFDSISVNSPYAMVEVCAKSDIKCQSPKGWDFTYGDDLVLRKVVDLRDTQNVVIDAVGHLINYRTVRLVQSGMAYEQAKQQANREILDALCFFKNSLDLLQDDGFYYDDAVAFDFINRYAQKQLGFVVSSVGRMGSFDSLSDSVKQSWLRSELWYLELDLLDSSRFDLWMTARSNFVAVLKGFGECTPEKEGTVIDTIYKLFNLVCKSGDWSEKNVVASVDSAGMMTDARDGKTYKTVSYNILGVTETWMAEDLIFNSSDGNYLYPDAIAMDSNVVMQSYDECVEFWLADWAKGKAEGLSAYDTMLVESMCKEYRANKSCIKYESFWPAVDSIVADKGFYQGVCPDGWRLPTGYEWERLMMYVADTYDNSEDPRSSPKYLDLAGFGTVLRQDGDNPWRESGASYAMAPDSSYRAQMYEHLAPVITIVRITDDYWDALPRAINTDIGSVVRVRCVKN